MTRHCLVAIGSTLPLLCTIGCGGSAPSTTKTVVSDKHVGTTHASEHRFDGQQVEFTSELFEAPVRIKAGDAHVEVESPGYACPTMADVDGDGKSDLVVGQFLNGHMQFCRNTAADGQPPSLAAAEWLMTHGARAVVPGVW